MTLLVRITFAVLVAATVAAFFVTQRLKRSPAIVARAHFGPEAFSPNRDGSYDNARIRFRLLKDDDVTVAVVDSGGDIVRTLRSSVHVRAHHDVELVWNGREDDGSRATDGYYRARLGLRHQGRTVVVPGVVKLDTKPPEPVITSVQGRGARGARTPLFVTHGHVTPLTVKFTGSSTRHSELLVERTDQGPPVVVARARGAPRRHTLRWDGLVHARPPAPGTYRLQVAESDLAGNPGRSPARAPGTGVTVRGVALQPPLAPTRAGHRATVFVDARRHRYRWALTGVGSRRVLAEGTSRRPRLHLRAPAGGARVYELAAAANGQRTVVPFVVGSPVHRKVLVVLPALRWLGQDQVDDDGDGLPDTLDRGTPAPLYRVFAALPVGFRQQEGRLLTFLDRHVHQYDLTTDAALALGRGPRLNGHTGVLLAGQETWLPPALGADLRRWVQRGGRLATFSTRTLRRSVRLAGTTLEQPGRLGPTDALRARLGPIVHRPGAITAFPPDKAGLFTTTDGAFGRWPAYEATRGLPGSTPLAMAGPDPQSPVILAYALGRGEVIRAGLPGWTGRLASSDSVSGLTDRAWTLLSH